MGQLFTLIVFTIVFIQFSFCDICEQCKCLESVEQYGINCSEATLENDVIFDMSKLSWPIVENETRIFINFNNFYFPTLHSLNGNDHVVSLNLDSCAIKEINANALIGFKNIEDLSLANNDIKELNKDFLKYSSKLHRLNLANNSLLTIDLEQLELLSLKEIDISNNRFEKLSLEFLTSIKNAEILNANSNKIYTLDGLTEATNLKHLTLAHNKISKLTDEMLTSFPKLEYLDISYNLLMTVDETALAQMEFLQFLDISYNQLQSIELTNMPRLEILNITTNKLKALILNHETFGQALLELNIQYNNLNHFELKNDDTLEVLNISFNSISSLPSGAFSKSMLTLDISYNNFTSIPNELGKRSPILETLVLDNNPLETLEVVEKLKLKRISLNNMPKLKTVDLANLTHLEGTDDRNVGQKCVTFSMSRCPELTEIFASEELELNFCELDLSYNKLERLPENLTNWEEIHGGINLQGNPLVCDCDSQWMLEMLLTKLYEKGQYQYLLHDLKCAAPEVLAGHRFVKYYKRFKAFCYPEQQLQQMEKLQAAGISGGGDSFNVHLQLNRGPHFMTVIMSCLVLLLAMICLGLWWRKQQRKVLMNNRAKRNRRFESIL